jgi:hypothetical protein
MVRWIKYMSSYFDEKISIIYVLYKGTVWYYVCNYVSLNFEIFFFAKIKCGLYLLNRFDVLMSKIIF